MSEPTWQDYRLFEFDEMVNNAINPPREITTLVGTITREVAEEAMLPYWVSMCRMIYEFERNFPIEVGGEGGES